MVENAENELNRLLRYLNFSVSNTIMTCTMNRKEGLYHRSSTNRSVGGHFDYKVRQKICSFKDSVMKLMNKKSNRATLSMEGKYC